MSRVRLVMVFAAALLLASVPEAAEGTAAEGTAAEGTSAAAPGRFAGTDLSSYYPGAGLRGMYESGVNYVPSAAPAVLWDDAHDPMTFFQHNWAPSDPKASCHADQLSWWPDGYLRY